MHHLQSIPHPLPPDPVIGIFACESQPVVLEGLHRIFAAHPDLALVGSSSDPLQALDAIVLSEPQVVLVDQTGGLRGAFRLLSELKARAPHTAPVLWVQELAEIESFRALQLGARGILRRTLCDDAEEDAFVVGAPGERRALADHVALRKAIHRRCIKPRR